MRVRRIGNSDIVALPMELEAAGYRPGVAALVQGTPEEEVRIVCADHTWESTRDLARRLVERHRRILERLAEYDRRG